MDAPCEKYNVALNEVYDSDMVKKEEQRNKVCHTHTHKHVNHVSNLRHAVPCRAVPCRATPCPAVPCRGMPRRAVPCLNSVSSLGADSYNDALQLSSKIRMQQMHVNITLQKG